MRGTSTITRATTATSTRTTTKRRSDRTLASRLLLLAAGWTLFAFAHSYRLTLVPLAGGVALLAVLRPPAIGRRPGRALDVALGLTLAAIAIQLVPLPAEWRGRLTPAALAYDRAMRFGGGPATAPLSVEPGQTLLALLAAATIILLFWCARTLLQRGGVRGTIRGIAWIGLFVSPLGIVHHVMPLPLVDRVWGLTSGGLRPYGPFVNRNDFAGWLIMAIPLTLAYAIARLQSRRRVAEPAGHDVIDTTSVWIGLAGCLMLGGLLFSVSRSGLLGETVGLACFAWLVRDHATARRMAWASLAFIAMLVVATVYSNIGELTSRFENAFADGFSGRLAIWRQTLPVIRDFWPLGSGAGTYQSVMVLYQTMSRYFYITHADNEGLQVLAEGGLLLAVPIAVALVAGMALVRKRLREDLTPIFWLRAGAASGMVAVVAQNMVEMTLRVPANAVLLAILAAIAVHEGDA